MAHRILIFLLLTMPISFKIELLPGVRFLLQEPFLLFFVIAANYNLPKFSIKSSPFIFLAISLLIILLSSIISLFFNFDVVGTIKILKYLLYVAAIITIISEPKYISEKMIKGVLNTCTIIILFSLSMYLVNFFLSEMSWPYYVSYSTWNFSAMPTGLSNITFDIFNFKFYRSGGNHGIYGSYIGLVLIFALRNLIKTNFRKSKLLCFLILVNLGFITSRESILLLAITTFLLIAHHFLTRTWIQKNIFLFSGLGIILLFLVLLVWQPNIVILNKINHMISSFNESGGFDRSVNYRFNTWFLFFGYLISHPWLFLTGIGFNKTRMGEILTSQEKVLGQEYFHVDLPESFYVTTLGYGGIFSLIFGLLFLATLIYICYQKGKIARVFSFFFIGLAITNFTSSSILGDLLLSQLGLIYAYVTTVKL